MTSTNSRLRLLLWNAAKLILALVLVGFVLSQTSLEQLAAVFENVSVPWLLFSLLIYLSATLLKALQYYVLMRAKVTYPQILNIIILQNAVSNFIATGAGIASYLASMRVEHDVKVSRSAIAFILTKIGDLVALWVALLVSSLIAWDHIGTLKNPTIALLVGIGAVIAVLISSIIFRQRFVSLLRAILDLLKVSRFGWIQKGMDVLLQLAERSEHGRVGSMLLTVLLLSSIYFIVTVGWSFANFMVFNLRVDVVELIYVSVLIQLVSFLPIQIFGGLGVAETTSIYFWDILGVPISVITPIMVGIRILHYLWNLVPLIYLPIYTIFISKRATVDT